jgi:hypothetical protein
MAGESSIGAILFGLCALILSGVGLSSLVHHRAEFFAANQGARQESVDREDRRLALLSRKQRLQDEFDALSSQAKTLRELHRRAKDDAHRLAALRGRTDELERACGQLTREFADYRAHSRDQAWRRATGERVGTLTLPNGRQFTGVTIVHITEQGIEISHDDGRARLPRTSLGPAWQERFQWQDQPEAGTGPR